MAALQTFTTLLLVQIFYAFAVSLLVPLIPGVAANQLVMFNNADSVINISTLGAAMQGGVSNQQNIPLLEFGALVFYSSNILLSLMINFFTAIPQMMSALLAVLFIFIPVNYTIQAVVKTFFIAMISILYYMVLFAFIMQFRSPNVGGVS